MTRDEIIRMAREAGIVVTGEAVWRLCELVAAAEREECAKVAAWILKMPENDVSSAIRARGMSVWLSEWRARAAIAKATGGNT